MGRGVLRLWGFLLLVDVIALMFGIAFLLIAHGLMMGIIRQAHHWQPAYRFCKRVADFPVASSTRGPITILGAVHSVISIALTVALVGFGIWILFKVGFCGQNLICMALH